ncbi:MAG: hypothetical protein FWE31_01630 [Firmicutes bacterium]|nr:hypothetical protein [Bacillota bacterium]
MIQPTTWDLGTEEKRKRLTIETREKQTKDTEDQKWWDNFNTELGDEDELDQTHDSVLGLA